MRDADLIYHDPDTSWDAEDAVIRRGAELFADVAVPVEIRNQKRTPCPPSLASSRRAPAGGRAQPGARGFAAVCCCVGLTVDDDGRPRVHAPYGFTDLLDLVVRPSGRPDTRATYEAKAARWSAVWPELTVLPWEPGSRAR